MPEGASTPQDRYPPHTLGAVDGDQYDRDQSRGDPYQRYRSSDGYQADPGGSDASWPVEEAPPRPGPWPPVPGPGAGWPSTASTPVPRPPLSRPADEPVADWPPVTRGPSDWPPVSRPPDSYRRGAATGRASVAGQGNGRPPSVAPNGRPPADWPPRQPTSQDLWGPGSPSRRAWTEEPSSGISPTWTPVSAPRNGEPTAWAPPLSGPPRNGEPTAWAPPLSGPPRTADATAWAPPRAHEESLQTDVRPEVARGVTARGELLRRGVGVNGSGTATATRTAPAKPPPTRTAPAKDGAAGGEEKRKGMPLWQELPLLLIVAFCLAVLIRTFLLQAFYIPSGSMENTLLIGDRVLVNKVVYDIRDPKRGEVVVFKGPSNWVPETPTTDQDNSFLPRLGRTIGDLVGISTPGEKDFIKRVVGLPGDAVACCDAEGRVTVNGNPLDEPYVTENSPLDTPPSANECRSRKFGPVKVPEGQIFVMGDHRLVSQDSRCQGPVPIGNVIGRAFIIVWPNSRWDTLPVPSTFDGVPKAMEERQRPSSKPDVAVLLPLVLSWYIPARSRHRLSSRHSRLAA
jgi:signal peptidase I